MGGGTDVYKLEIKFYRIDLYTILYENSLSLYLIYRFVIYLYAYLGLKLPLRKVSHLKF